MSRWAHPREHRTLDEEEGSIWTPPALDRHWGHFRSLLAEDGIFEALRELRFAPGDTFDRRFKLQVHRPDRRGCASTMEAVARSSETLGRVVQQLCDFFHLEPQRCWVNLYRGHSDDQAAFHRDNFDGRSGGPSVDLGLFASFGAPRKLCWAWDEGGQSRWVLRHGDVFAFDRVANGAGQHAIEPDELAGDRISVSLWGCGQIPDSNPEGPLREQRPVRR
ncbi:unnamed protein product, partial [Effrenium voratum]